MRSRSPFWFLALAGPLFVTLAFERDQPEPSVATPRAPSSRGDVIEGMIELPTTEAMEGALRIRRQEMHAATNGSKRGLGELAITVSSALGGQRLAGALLTFTHRHGRGRPLDEAPGPVQARADASGLAELRVASGWQGWLDVEVPPSSCAPGAPAAAARPIAPLAPGERREVTVALDTGSPRAFWLRVVDDRGAPIRAGLRWQGKGAQGPEVLAGPDGLVRLTSAEPQRHRIRIDAAHHVGVEILPPREEEWDGPPLEVVLQRVGSLRLRLAPAHEQRALLLEVAALGSPRVVPRTIPLDTSERAFVEDLPPGTALALRLVTQGGCLVRALPTLTLAPGEERELFVCGPAAAVMGTLRDEGGAPLVGCEVRALRSASFATGHMSAPVSQAVETTDRTGADGTFALAGLAQGWWTIAARPEGLGLVERTLWLEEGGSEDLSLVARRGCWIRGRVVDGSGKPIADAFVEALASDGSESFQDETDARGDFLLGPALAEEHMIRALGPWRHGVEAYAFARPRATVELVARRGGGLSVQVLSAASGRPVPATVTVHAGERPLLARTDAEGRARVEGLEPGCQRVTVTGDDGSFAEATVFVDTGAYCEAQLVLRRQAGPQPDLPPADPATRDPVPR